MRINNYFQIDPYANAINGDWDRRGNPINGETPLLLLNAHHEPHDFTLPAHREDVEGELLLDTRNALGRPDSPARFKGGDAYPMESRSLALLAQRTK